MHRFFFTGLFLFIYGMNWAQEFPKTSFESTDSLYNANIKKSRLYGVYIPRDIDDALDKLMELSEEDARQKLLKITEDEASRKLFFGIGRWMAYNWNFDEGSRFSHYLRQKGLIYTDDMVRCMIILFHRKISEKPLNEDQLIENLVEQREKIIEKEKKDRQKIISEEVIQKNPDQN